MPNHPSNSKTDRSIPNLLRIYFPAILMPSFINSPYFNIRVIVDFTIYFNCHSVLRNRPTVQKSRPGGRSYKKRHNELCDYKHCRLKKSVWVFLVLTIILTLSTKTYRLLKIRICSILLFVSYIKKSHGKI